MKPNKNFKNEFNRIIKNCQFYEDKFFCCKDKNYLVNLTSEIGALRGLSYGYMIYHNDFCPLEFEQAFIYFIGLGKHIQEKSEVDIEYAES